MKYVISIFVLLAIVSCASYRISDNTEFLNEYIKDKSLLYTGWNLNYFKKHSDDDFEYYSNLSWGRTGRGVLKVKGRSCYDDLKYLKESY